LLDLGEIGAVNVAIEDTAAASLFERSGECQQRQWETRAAPRGHLRVDQQDAALRPS